MLRAINIGGAAKLDATDFCAALTAFGFEYVQSAGISPNFIFDSALDTETALAGINSILQTQFKISGERTVLRDHLGLERLIKTNPFKDAVASRPEKLHVLFLSTPPQSNAETNLTSYKGPERLRLDGHNLYIDYINGASDTALTARFLETALGTNGTARDWNTVMKLVEMARTNTGVGI